MLVAYQAGDKGEARRRLHQACALLTGREWTASQEFARSLVLRTSTAVADPGRPLVVRLEQLYRPSSSSKSSFRVQVLLLHGRTPKRTPPIKDFGVRESASSDLTDSPFSFTLDAKDVKEGNYKLGVVVLEGDTPTRRITMPLFLIRDFEAIRRDVEKRLEAVSGYESLKATIRYPFDLAKQVNLGLNEPGPHDIRAGVRRSQTLLVDLEEGRDPLTGMTGDRTRHYWFEEAGEILPYRLYVPKDYNGESAYPLIVALHGGGGSENTMIGGPRSPMKTLAEKHGYIVAAPSGYRPFGGYGKSFDKAKDPDLFRMTRLSEMDVMNVLKLVREEYRVDPKRIYLTGHSMGGNGTWRLGAKHADVWAALAPVSSGQATPEGFAQAEVAVGESIINLSREPYDFEAIRRIPVFVCHGALDPRAPVDHARRMVSVMGDLGMNCAYFEKANGTHAMMEPSRPMIFDFLNRVDGKRDPKAIAESLKGFLQRDAAAPVGEDGVALEDFEARVFTDKAGRSIPYRLFIPKDYDPAKKYPLVTFFHGKGRKGTDNRKQVTLGSKLFAHPENQRKHPCFVLAPQSPPDSGWRQEFADKRRPVDTALDIIDALEKEFSIDTSREYLTGQSGGGTASWCSLLKYPDRFAAAAIVCAGIDFTPEEMPEIAERFKTVPLWLFHGEVDQLVPVERSRMKFKALKAVGGNVRYTEYPKVRHNSWDHAYVEPDLVDWLFGHARKSMEKQ